MGSLGNCWGVVGVVGVEVRGTGVGGSCVGVCAREATCHRRRARQLTVRGQSRHQKHRRPS